MQTSFKIALVAASCLTAASCTKEGLGGKATVVATLQHHHQVITSQVDYRDSVFVKFDAKEAPGTMASDYDAVFIGEPGEDHVHVNGLKPGNYFIYGVGLDTAINQRVKGGVSIKIKHKEKDEEILLDLPVTEE